MPKRLKFVIGLSIIGLCFVFEGIYSYVSHPVQKPQPSPFLIKDSYPLTKNLPFDLPQALRNDLRGWPDDCDATIGISFKYPSTWHVNGISSNLTIVSPPDAQNRSYKVPGDGRLDFGVEISALGKNVSTLGGATENDVAQGFLKYSSVPFSTTTFTTTEGKRVFLVYNIYNDPLGIVAYVPLSNKTVEVSFDRFFDGKNDPGDWEGYIGIISSLREEKICQGGDSTHSHGSIVEPSNA